MIFYLRVCGDLSSRDSAPQLASWAGEGRVGLGLFGSIIGGKCSMPLPFVGGGKSVGLVGGGGG